MALAIAIASVVLGLGFTALLGTAGYLKPHTPPVPDGPYPNASGQWGRQMMGSGMMGRFPAAPPSCPAPALPGTVVDATLTDMGAMMGPGTMGPGMMNPNGLNPNDYLWPHMGMMGMPGMQRISLSPANVAAGPVSFRVLNSGFLSHELVVLPLAQGQSPGQRSVGIDGKVDEAGSLGEASRTCGPDNGDEQTDNPGIAPGATGWTTINLPPGRYEVICNIAGHYGAGMYAALDVSGPSR